MCLEQYPAAPLCQCDYCSFHRAVVACTDCLIGVEPVRQLAYVMLYRSRRLRGIAFCIERTEGTRVPVNMCFGK